MRSVLRALLQSQQTSMRSYAATMTALAAGQEPKALFVTCADSRIVPSVLTATDPGDLFVVRNIGNLVPPVDHDGRSTGDVSEASAVAYAVDNLGVGEVVVCGHSNCGAMLATLAPDGVSDPNLASWLARIRPLCERLESDPSRDHALSPHDQLSQWNAVLQLEHLRTYPSVRRGLARGTLELSALWLDLSHARVLIYSASERRFVPVDEALDEDTAA